MEPEPEPIFTRYLYIKNDVVWSLFHSIVWNDLPQSLFWAYELYYSGFQDETFAFLQYVYEECYQNANPKAVQDFLQKTHDTWKTTPNQDALVATYLANMIYRKHDLLAFIQKYDYNAYEREPEPDEVLPSPILNKCPKKIVFVNYKEEDIKTYKTVIPSNKIKASQLLKQMRIYTPRNDGPEYCACLEHTFMGKYMTLPYSRDEIDGFLKTSAVWLYYASATPVWRQRLQAHKGAPNHETKTIVFQNDIMKYAFLGKYGYVVAE